jgi:hypothetical protein
VQNHGLEVHVGKSRQLEAGRDWRFVLLVALGWILSVSPALDAGPHATKAPKPNSKWDKETKRYLKGVKPSTVASCRWMVETPTHVLHSTLSKEYTAAAAVHLLRFDQRFRSIFKGQYKDADKPTAYAFATEKEYLKFSPGSEGTQGRFLVSMESGTLVKNLAWFSTPPGENDFYRTDIGVVQHEATHQLLHAYTGNQRVPKWFDEGCAAFFESWDLDKKNDENILSGLAGEYARGISLTYPMKDGLPPLASFWILPDKLLLLDHVPRMPGPTFRVPDLGKKDMAAEFASRMRVQQEYNEAWCAMTFLIQHPVGQQVFKKLVSAFRERGDLEKIRKRYYTEEFLKSFRTEWYRFIEEKVLPGWELPAVGGGTFPRGLTAAPPTGTRGFGLTKDNRGDMFLVDAEERTISIEGRARRVWMLKAWSIPARFYEEAWEAAPSVVTQGPVAFVGGLYMPGLFSDASSDFRAIFLQPAFTSLSKEDSKNLAARLTDAAIGLILPRGK